MPTAEELVVALRSEGATEVNDDLKTTEERMEDTADSADQQADRLGGFANKIKGAMAAIVAGLAIGAAGILSQVPVIGQAMSGLKAVFDAIVFRIDKQLRPGISSLSNEFFELANAIFAGDYKQAKKELKDIANTIKSFLTGGNITQLVKQFQDFAAEGLGFLVTQITQFAQTLTTEDFKKFYGTIIRLLKRGLNKLIGAADWSKFAMTMLETMGKAIVGRSQAVKQEIIDPLVDYIEDNWEEWLSTAIQFGKDLVNKIIDGIEQKTPALEEELNTEIVAGITTGDLVGQVGRGAGVVQGSVKRGGEFVGGLGNGSINLDGRDITEDTGRYRSDPSRRRGI